MKLHRGYPPASERMGFLRTLASVEGLCIVEFGPEGTTRYLLESLEHFGCPARANIFTTMMDENTVILGNTDRLLRALREVDARHSPPFILVMDSSVAAVTGMDMDGLCREYQPKIRARLLPVSGGGLRALAPAGVEEALLLLASLAEDGAKQPGTFNLLGSCADEFNAEAEADEMIALLATAFGWRPHIVLPLRASVESCRTLGSAALNVVLRGEALAAAKLLRERFGTPYVEGRPYGLRGTLGFVERLAEAAGQTPDWGALDKARGALEQALEQGRMALVRSGGKAVVQAPAYAADGLRAFVRGELGGELLREGASRGEIAQAALVLADGLTLRHASRAAVQADFPAIDSRFLSQGALMGFDGAARIIQSLKSLP